MGSAEYTLCPSESAISESLAENTPYETSRAEGQNDNNSPGHEGTAMKHKVGPEIGVTSEAESVMLVRQELGHVINWSSMAGIWRPLTMAFLQRPASPFLTVKQSSLD